MPKGNEVGCIAFTLTVLLAGSTTLGLGQFAQGVPTPDSLVRLLSSPDWQVRNDAVARLNLLPANRLPSNYSEVVIPLFEREATSVVTSPAGEGYGEYLLELMQGVVRLRDRRSLRGLALLGIRMSREAEEYVASQGSASIPFLDEAWALSHNDAIATTWAYLLGQYPQALSRPQRLQVKARLFDVLPANSRAFVWAALMGPLPELAPVVEGVATGDSMPSRRQAASQVLAKLRPIRDRLSPSELFGRVSDWFDAFCVGAAGARNSTCQSLSTRLTAAKGQLEVRGLSGARPALEELARQADAALGPDQLTASEHRFLRGNVEYLTKRAQ